MQMELTSLKADITEKPVTKENTSSLLLSCGFLCLEDLPGKEAKTIITFIDGTVKKVLTTEEIEKTVKRIADLDKKNPLRNKYSYLITSLKNTMKDKDTIKDKGGGL